MRHTLFVSALLVIAVSSACTREGTPGVVPESLTAMAAYRCNPIDMADVTKDGDTCASKTMAGQRASR